MPPKAPKAKPKPIPRRGAAASASSSTAPPEASTTTTTTTTTTATTTTLVAPVSAAPEAPPPPEPKETKPIAPPKGRLDSLAPSIRGAGAPKIKFKPKVVARRTKEERENLDAKFQEAQQAAAAASERGGRGGSARGARGGRGGRGRGRGGFDMPLGASGPFALGSVVTAQRQKVFAERGPSLGGSGKSSRAFSYRSRVKSEGVAAEEVKVDYSSSDESDGQRMDVEFISLLDVPSDDEDGDRNMDTEWGAGAPIRILRSEHVDRQAMVNTESSAKKGKAELKAMKEKEMTFESEIKIKDEPEDDEGITLPPSPELSKRRVKLSESPTAKMKEPGAKPRRRRSSTRGKKLVISTTEEKEEFERLEYDRLAALKELGGDLEKLHIKAQPKGEDADGDVDMISSTDMLSSGDAPQTTRNAETDNQIFFFQFPPLLPHLVPASTILAKAEPTSTLDVPEVKAEPGTAVARKNALKGKALLRAQMALLTAPPPPGHVGKLRVHRSGRISMLWGDGKDAVEMVVNRGAECTFLQEVVVVKEKSPYGDDDMDEKGRQKGVAYSLGQVKGKYVVSPEFLGLIKASSGKRPATKKEEDGGMKEEVKAEGEGKGKKKERIVLE